ALMHFHEARGTARTDNEGNAVLLDDQDRSLWDQDHIARAYTYLDRALARESPGPYQIQAAISAVHIDAATADETDWQQIAALYGSLRRHIDSPIVHLNHAVAVAQATEPANGLTMIDTITGLDDYPYFHAARASLLRESGDIPGAATAFAKARDVSTSEAQRRFFNRSLDALG
ncbi:MAG: DUF6596 domain-containing protein, partial [Acidimicrobiia bacterium]